MAGSVLICKNVPLRSLIKSSLNTSFHPHPFSLFLGALKCSVRHGKKENETCTALLLLEEVLPLTHRPWFQLFLALAKLGYKKKKWRRKYPNPTKNIKKSLNISKWNIPKWLPETQLSCWTLQWQLRREADKCSAVRNPWRETRWKCKINTCMKSLPEVELRSATPQDWAIYKISQGHTTSIWSSQS